ncbi:hypothetical protein AB0M54_45910 [Actinoplanes sp. NPDC051470]|uniref:hypothetical protein n=1 Tax=Actinoplanes sp. NPDC051470 TaxID=3157224 RepID=UPI0034132826
MWDTDGYEMVGGLRALVDEFGQPVWPATVYEYGSRAEVEQTATRLFEAGRTLTLTAAAVGSQIAANALHSEGMTLIGKALLIATRGRGTEVRVKGEWCSIASVNEEGNLTITFPEGAVGDVEWSEVEYLVFN